ncbi:arginine deiminase family protein [Adhaeribacter rhizoryzae]|uniref:arginine deiminase n=1 Tax=Adhaeribacter rhizoryzae TaxID=2607907 RepID=A0A5M6DMW0_9BACT|nr:arginine deiminase family protein [Adhaeribacter rhizoryzae]KAA5547579.1 amidinotransferase [Adhaeribacter rhizoryzae]
MAAQATQNRINVNSEIGDLKRILIHRPDIGIGKIIPTKFQDWMYDDIVHLNSMKKEYDEYIKILLYFLDPEKIKEIDELEAAYKHLPEGSDCLNPSNPEYFNSDKVLDVQKVLSSLLNKETSDGQPNQIRNRIISAICAIEECSFETEQLLHQLEPNQLSKTLITGLLPQDLSQPDLNKFLFPPVPNLVFTRDIGAVIGDKYLLSKACKKARKRESLLIKFIAYYHFFAEDHNQVLEIIEDSAYFLLNENDQRKNKVTLEGGDVMIPSPRHVLIGCSERTSASAVNGFIHKIFSLANSEVEQITVVKIPQRREQMHIDTVFTQVKLNIWVLYGKFSEALQELKESKQVDYLDKLYHHKEDSFLEETEIYQFYKNKYQQPYHPEHNYLLQTEKDYAILNQGLAAQNLPAVAQKPKGLEHLLRQLSIIEFKVAPEDVIIIYCGGGNFPDDDREQWTDGCNLLALREGVVIGYDRNTITNQEFRQAYFNHYKRRGEALPAGMAAGFEVISAGELLRRFKAGEATPATVKDTLIELSSDELSRARGGSRCMSQPLLRAPFNF